MSLSNRWNSLSRLNRTRVLVAVFLVSCVAVAAGVPILLFSNVI